MFRADDDLSFEERTKEQRFCLKYLKTCCIDAYLLWLKPTRRCYLRWRPWLKLLFFFALFGYLLRFILSRKLQEKSISLSSNKIHYRSRDLRVPQYLLFNVDDNSQSTCSQIFESIIPHNLRPNITDKDLVKSLFGNKVNLAYVIHSDANKVVTPMHGKLCSNASNEWILLTLLEKESLDENTYGIEASSDESREAQKCVSLDFKKCSLNNLHNDYPRLFQLDHEQHIKRNNSTKKRPVHADIFQTIYYYDRRRAADYLQYKEQLTKIDVPALNMTIVPDSITSDRIRIRVKLTENDVLLTHMDCAATLQQNNSSPIHSRQMVDSVIEFDQLNPSTSYNVCISCEETITICKQINTSKMALSTFDFKWPGTPSSFKAKPEDVSEVILPCCALIIVILLAASSELSLLKSFFALFRRRGPRGSILPSEHDQVQNSEEEGISTTDHLLSSSCSKETLDGQSARDSRSVSSVSQPIL